MNFNQDLAYKDNSFIQQVHASNLQVDKAACSDKFQNENYNLINYNQSKHGSKPVAVLGAVSDCLENI